MFCSCMTSSVIYLTIRQRGRVVYEKIVNEGEVRIDYLLLDNEAELSNCFSIHSHLTKTQTVNDKTRQGQTRPKVLICKQYIALHCT